MPTDHELAAADAINAELGPGYGPLSVEDCKTRYGAAFTALVSVLRGQAQNKSRTSRKR